jgi:hypothetical protein
MIRRLEGSGYEILSFWQQDPLAGGSPDYSAYAYVGNNPMLYSDPLGLRQVPQSGPCHSCMPPIDGIGDGRQLAATGAGSSAMQMLTGIGSTGFEDWVNGINAQIDQEVERKNLISMAQRLAKPSYSGRFDINCRGLIRVI